MVKALRYYSDGPGIDFRWCHCIFQWHISFRPYHDPGVDSAPSENEYQVYFLGVKAAGAWGWQPHHLNMPNIMKIWEPKPPETLWTTPGLLGTPLPFTFTIQKSVQVRGKCLCFAIKPRFYGEELSKPRPTPKLEDHPLLVVHGCLFNVFPATLHIGGRSSIHTLKTRHAMVTQTHLSWTQ